jgi:hypothetical protein
MVSKTTVTMARCRDFWFISFPYLAEGEEYRAVTYCSILAKKAAFVKKILGDI